MYVLVATIQSSVTFPEIKTLTPMAIAWLTNEAVFDTAAEVVGDIMSSYFAFFGPSDVTTLASILSGPWALAKFRNLVDPECEDDSDSHRFIKLIVAFAEATVQTIARNPHDPHSQALIQMLHGMLTCPGYPIVEDEIAPQAFEFWSSLIEFLLDSDSGEDEPQPWVNLGKRHIFQAIQEYWVKIKIPPSSLARSWPQESKEGFTSFRKDVADLVETAYPLLHEELFEQFVTHALACLENPDWEVNISRTISTTEADNSPPRDEVVGTRGFVILPECIKR